MSANPNMLAAASAFDSFKNYGSFSGDVVVSGTVSGTPPTNFATYSASFDLTRTDILTQIYMSTTLSPGNFFNLVGGYSPVREGSIPGPVLLPYNVAFTFTFIDNIINVQAAIQNPYGDTLTVATETITFTVKTFIGAFAE